MRTRAGRKGRNLQNLSEWQRINVVREKEKEKQNPRVSFIEYRQPYGHAGTTKDFLVKGKKKYFTAKIKNKKTQIPPKAAR